ncbi:MAG: energy transducer TonB [Pseudomonadota bacterium]|nr:energy transducer TonB [Pseudomonadota bacterium]
MTDLRILSFSILVSLLIHTLVISHFNLIKKDNEVYVLDLSEFQEYTFSQPKSIPPPIKKAPPQPKIKKKPKPKLVKKKLEKKDVIPLKKEEPKRPVLLEKKEKIEKKIEPKKEVVNKTISSNVEKKKFSLQKKEKSILVNKLLSEYLNSISFEINKRAAKSYPRQSIKRREQGTIISVLTINKGGNLVDVYFENKSPKRLYKATMTILKSFSFPKPPEAVLDNKDQLKIKIPVNFILK